MANIGGKNTTKKFISFDQKWLFTYPKASLKDVQATGKAFSTQKKTPSTSKIKFINFFQLA